MFALERDFASLYNGASCRKTNSPMRLRCRYQAKHSKLTEEIRLLSEATTYIFPHRNGREKQFILYIQLTVIHVRFPVFWRDVRVFCQFLNSSSAYSVTGETTIDQRNLSIIGSDDVHISS